MMFWLISLMMSPMEEHQLGEIGGAWQMGMVTPPVNEHEKPAQLAGSHCAGTNKDEICILGMIYTAPNQWIVWVNDQKCRPQSSTGPGFRISKVDSMGVHLVLHRDPDKVFILVPGERLNCTTGKVTD